MGIWPILIFTVAFFENRSTKNFNISIDLVDLKFIAILGSILFEVLELTMR